MGEYNEGAWVWVLAVSALTSHHTTEVDSNLVMALFAITANLFARHIPSILLLVMCFTCPNPIAALPLHRTACAKIGSTAPPLATLAPSKCFVCVHNQCLLCC